ncbi:hypothetical protein [Micromonospora sp. DT47]|uniref:hypothetical protein n=1 Tax=Micromonospora sp. DT47 TaxID=3393431 RepID=UPI003CE7E3E8
MAAQPSERVYAAGETPVTAVKSRTKWVAWVGAGALAAVLVTVGVGLLFLRASTAVEELRTA